MPKKLTYEYVKQKIKEIADYTLVSTTYTNSKTKMNMTCDQGHSIEMHYNAITNDDKCHLCANRIPITLERINVMCNEKGLTLISYEKIKWDSPLSVKCERGHVFLTAYNNLKDNDVKCYECFQRICRSCSSYLTLEEMEKRKDSPNGHSRMCKKCANKYKGEKRKTPEGRKKDRKRAIKYVNENREKVNKYAKDWRNKHKDTINPKQKTARDNDIERYREKERERFQVPSRKLKHSINQANRRAKKLKATPPWLTDAQKQEIVDFYTNRPPGYHVDHIEPLRGKDICGLHVPWNLQYLPGIENIRKGNRRCKN